MTLITATVFGATGTQIAKKNIDLDNRERVDKFMKVAEEILRNGGKVVFEGKKENEG